MSFPLVSHAADYGGKIRKANYAWLGAGIFSPRADLDDLDLEDGYAINMAFGHYFTDRIVVELGSDVYQADGNSGGVSRGLLIVPMTVTAKYMIPTSLGEFYLGAGGGIYFVRLKQSTGGVTTREHDVVAGGHLVVGANFDVTDDVFLGVEGKWTLTDHAKLYGQRLNLSGGALTGHAGIRF